MATILLVEDDTSMRLLTTAKLKHRYAIISVQDGVEALDVLERQPVDLTIADVMMPRMDGYTLVKTLRERGDQIPVLLLTAKQSFEDKREGFSSGVDDYMTKPVNYEELIWRLDALLRGRTSPASIGSWWGGQCWTQGHTPSPGRGRLWSCPKRSSSCSISFCLIRDRSSPETSCWTGVWGYDSESGEDTVKTHISRLRNKLRDIPEFRIVTIKGLGYKAEITKEEQP